MKTLRRHRLSIAVFLITLQAMWQVTPVARGATIDWSAGSSTDFVWGNLLNWAGGVPTGADDAVFVSPIPNPGTLPNSGVIVLGASSVANSLNFRDRYTLSGGDLTLTSGNVRVDLAQTATISSQLTGGNGLSKTGGGTLRLTNSSNNYTGITSISNGSIVLSNPAALGTDTSTVLVSGSATRGFGGGSLVLEGAYASGVDFTRNITATGLGPITDRGAALVSVGLNQLSGQVSMAQGLVNTRFISAGGLLSFTSGLDVAGTAGTTVSQFGGVNTAGAGGYSLTGVLTGVGTLEKTGSGTLLLTPSDTSGFSGTVRVSTSATGVTSTVRITTPNVLGTRTATGTGGVIDLNGGVLEVRMDTPSVLAGGAPANVYHRGGGTTSAIFVDHAPGSTAINQLVTFGQLAFEENLTLSFNGRNGYGMTFGAAPVQGGTAASTITNNMNGNLTFSGAFWSNADTTSRTMTINGAGNTFITGNFTASSTTASVDHSLTKAGTGTLTISSTGGTLDGAVNINAGTLAIADFRSVNNSNANTSTASLFAINIGSSGTAGTLTVGVNGVTPTGAGLTSQRTINLAGTTGGGQLSMQASRA